MKPQYRFDIDGRRPDRCTGGPRWAKKLFRQIAMIDPPSKLGCYTFSRFAEQARKEFHFKNNDVRKNR
jgi:hypothetical protein